MPENATDLHERFAAHVFKHEQERIVQRWRIRWRQFVSLFLINGMRWLLFSVLCLLSCCRPCSYPDLMMPTFYIEENPEENQGVDNSLSTWWEQFDDPQLTWLIEHALAYNYDLLLARERICEARAIVGIEFSRMLPHVDAFVLFNRMRNSQTIADANFTGGAFTNFYQAGFDTIWEIDLFGKNLNRTNAAAADLVAQNEEVRSVHVSVASEVAINYFIIRTLQERIDITKRHIAAESELVELVKDRFAAGLISQLDVYTADALLQERIAFLPKLTIRLYQTIYALAVLIGEIPETLADAFCETKPLPEARGKIPLGLPSDLLCNRGDVRAAEFAMLASGARVLAARKELFPTISLDSLFSYATGFFTQWAKGQSKDWSRTPSIFLPIFHGGRILSHIQAETSKQHQAVMEYELSVLKALEEVESSLTSYFRLGARIDALEREVTAYREGRKLAATLYFGGVVDFLYVLETERDLFISENVLAESREELMRSLVSSYKALGGGWECCE